MFCLKRLQRGVLVESAQSPDCASKRAWTLATSGVRYTKATGAEPG